MNVLGLMSGTSLDGLDLCLTTFVKEKGRFEFKIIQTVTIDYPQDLQEKLKNAIHLSGEQLIALDNELGTYFGNEINTFRNSCSIKIDYIASHGHTIFHQPEKHYTCQIGNGYQIYSTTGIPVIYDFRSLDVALGGQGAPLVPIGDLHLFDEYIACINFGGIANLSFQAEGKRLAFDICPVNMALSTITNEVNLPYDDGGMIARSGKVNMALLKALNDLDFYRQPGPKSLGVEWFNKSVLPIIADSNVKIADRLATVIEHIADQVANCLMGLNMGRVLVSGGGVYNAFLMEEIQLKVKHELIIPVPEIIEFKEALIFAFLGYLKVNGEVNVLKSVTGASKDSISGILIA